MAQTVGEKIIYSYEVINYPEWKKENYISEYKGAKEKLLQQIGNYSQVEAKSLQDQLNQMMKEMQFEYDDEDGLGNLILTRLNSYVDEQGEAALKAGFNLNVTSSVSSNAWSEYYREKNKYDKIKDETQRIEGEQNLKELKRKAIDLSKKTNKLKGDLLEAFLGLSIPVIQQNIAELAEDGTKEMADILKTVKSNIVAITDNDSNAKISTQGAEHDKTIYIKIGEEVWRITSQGKIDTVVESPDRDETKNLNISAKNYAKLQNISMVSDASIPGLVSQWPVTYDAQNYFLNALTVWNTPKQAIEYGKMIFAIQALAGGRENKEGKKLFANVLILNLRNNKTNPIRVISIPAFLKKAFDECGNNAPSSFEYIFKPQLQYFETGDTRDNEEFAAAMKAAHLNIKLKKEALYVSELNNLLNYI